MTANDAINFHHQNLNTDECKAAFDDWIEEQCKDFVNDMNARYQMKMYKNGMLMVVKK